MELAPFEEFTFGDITPRPRDVTPVAVRAKADKRPAYSGAFASILAEENKSKSIFRQSQGGMTVDQQVSAMTGYVYSCVSQIAEGVAQVPLRIYQTALDGTKPSEIKDRRFPLSALIENPNPHDTRFEFWRFTIQYLLLTGNAYWLKVYDNPDSPKRKLRELWPLPSQFVAPVVDGVFGLSHYEWTHAGNSQPIPIEYICHFRNTNPKDRFNGISVLAAAAAAKKSQDAIKSSQLASLDTAMQSSLFLTTEEHLTEDQTLQILAGLISKYGGHANAGVPPLLYGGVKPVFRNRPAAEMDYPASNAMTRDEIFAVFRVPPLFGMQVATANNSNTAAQERVFYKQCIWPLCISIHQRINKDICREFGPNIEVEFDNPVKGDELVDAKIIDMKVKNGTLTVDEAREIDGREPLPKAEPVAQPPSDQQQPAADQNATGNADQNPASQVEGAQQVKSVVQVGGPLSRRESDGQRQPITANNREHSPAVTDNGDPSKLLRLNRGSAVHRHYRAVLARSAKSDLAKLEDESIPIIRKFFIAQAKRIQAAIANLGRSLKFVEQRKVVTLARIGDSYYRVHPDRTITEELGDLDCVHSGRSIDFGCLHSTNAKVFQESVVSRATAEELIDWEAEADRLLQLYNPQAARALGVGGDAQHAQLATGNSFDINSPEAESWLRQKDQSGWASNVNKTTRDRLNEELSQVMNEGFNTEKAAEAVERVMGDRIKSDSKTIARTESTSAYNAGADIVRDQVNVREKEWLATFDDLTRPEHEQADSQVVDQKLAFDVGGEKLRFPGDPNGSAWNVINCRCVAVAAYSDVPLEPVEAE